MLSGVYAGVIFLWAFGDVTDSATQPVRGSCTCKQVFKDNGVFCSLRVILTVTKP